MSSNIKRVESMDVGLKAWGTYYPRSNSCSVRRARVDLIPHVVLLCLPSFPSLTRFVSFVSTHDLDIETSTNRVKAIDSCSRDLFLQSRARDKRCHHGCSRTSSPARWGCLQLTAALEWIGSSWRGGFRFTCHFAPCCFW